VPHIAPAGTYWLDLSRDAHPIDKDCTEIGTAANAANVGALFLDANTARIIGLDSGTKHPVLQGSELLFPLR
jgi:hypothetical protein